MTLSQYTDRINDGKMTLETVTMEFGSKNCIRLMVGLANGGLQVATFDFKDASFAFYEMIFEAATKRGGLKD